MQFLSFSSYDSPHLGFTLLELITTLAIISLLITSSYPIYTQYLIKTHRAEAKIALLDLASNLEQYHVIHNTYAGATLENMQINQYTEGNFYRLEINSTTEKNYLLKAVPLGIQIEDKACGVLSLNQLGEIGVTESSKMEACW